LQPDLPRAVVAGPYNGGLAVARALVRRGLPVTVLAGRADAFTTKTRGVAGEVLAPLDTASVDWLERLRAEGDCVVLTGSDAVSELLARERAELPQTRTFESLDDAHLPLMSKAAMNEIADRAGVRRPRGFTVATLDALETAASELSYPAILKPTLSHLWRGLFGDDRVILADSRAELVESGREAIEAGLELIVGEYVPGGDDMVEEAILVRDRQGGYPVALGCRKLRQFPAGFGAASLCETAPIAESMELAKRLLDEAGYVGVAGVETKRHATTGEPYLLEVNVRIPTQWGLGDAAGGDCSWRLYATLAGIALDEPPPIRPGVKLVFPELELRAALRAMRARDGSGPGLLARLRSWRGAGDMGIFDLRDPGPAIARARTAAVVRLKRKRQGDRAS
jgi:predicted ATP-grasp superfamily ATP-dependent carboligase